MPATPTVGQILHLLAGAKGPCRRRVPDVGIDAHRLIQAGVLHPLLRIRQGDQGHQRQKRRQSQAQKPLPVHTLSSRIMVMTPASISQTVSQRASISPMLWLASKMVRPSVARD